MLPERDRRSGKFAVADFEITTVVGVMDVDAAEVAGIAPDQHAPGRTVPFDPWLQRARKIVDMVDHHTVAPQCASDHGQEVDQERTRVTRGGRCAAFGRKGAQDDDVEVAKVYEKAGAKVSALDATIVGKWRDIARDTAWKDYSGKTATSANLMKLAADA